MSYPTEQYEQDELEKYLKLAPGDTRMTVVLASEVMALRAKLAQAKADSVCWQEIAGDYRRERGDKALVEAIELERDDLRANLSALTQKLVEAGELHLADEQSVRNMQAKLDAAVEKAILAEQKRDSALYARDLAVAARQEIVAKLDAAMAEAERLLTLIREVKVL